ncbi:aspartate aminotransferase family protein [Beijerinckia indica]|uniref:Aminotransferase class-III n=1 Tax=Beijerinckia indica subsp. indica (strain ATCC 9039 / DSM 1715 / NCIMB 8712) TaxID=395963 RepID=B2ID10_BEII9|nr:aminotransferase class III-fold pyridoxal phosphate-dependent enzyme [Beijerinckia indica]ACB96775.1 aminotransferase class-III [Beijerinckia indica subsp. indica ATCC 9039]
MKNIPVQEIKPAGNGETFDIKALLAAREPERYSLHTHYLNEMMVKVLQTIGYDVGFKSGQGQYLFDRNDARYLDLLSGWGVFAIGRNHPLLRETLTSVLASDLPNLVQMDVSVLAGLLAERLLGFVPFLDKVFFCNSGTEAVEAAIKFARRATGRPGIVYCEHAFHGLSYGSLSLNGDQIFREGFGDTLPGCHAVPFNDLAALEKALAKHDIAAFIVEPVQGKGVNLPDDGYLAGVQALCRKYGTLFVADEIQTGLGRTGKFLAIEHWGVEPDMVLVAKALSGGHVPVGAVLSRKGIFEKVFSRMDRAVVHGSTFAKNDLAMAAGLATLEVIEREQLVEKAARNGERLLTFFQGLADRYELVRTVRGKGLMIGIEFGAPRSLKLKASWTLLETVNTGLFCQLITIPLFKEHKILVQVAGHASHTVKLLPTLVIDDGDCDWIERAFETVIADSHKVPGAVWSLGKTLADHAMKARAAK